jgi:hypothetical protein
MAAEVKRYLSDKNLLAEQKSKADEFYVTQLSPTFEPKARIFYPISITLQEAIIHYS